MSPEQAGSGMVDIDTRSDVYSLGVLLNDAPVITSSPVTTGTDGSAYAYDVDADDPDVGDTATFSLDQPPSGMTIDANTGVISWTPQSSDVGAANDVTVRVTDGEGAYHTQSFTINVSAQTRMSFSFPAFRLSQNGMVGIGEPSSRSAIKTATRSLVSRSR